MGSRSCIVSTALNSRAISSHFESFWLFSASWSLGFSHHRPDFSPKNYQFKLLLSVFSQKIHTTLQRSEQANTCLWQRQESTLGSQYTENGYIASINDTGRCNASVRWKYLNERRSVASVSPVLFNMFECSQLNSMRLYVRQLVPAEVKLNEELCGRQKHTTSNLPRNVYLHKKLFIFIYFRRMEHRNFHIINKFTLFFDEKVHN